MARLPGQASHRIAYGRVPMLRCAMRCDAGQGDWRCCQCEMLMSDQARAVIVHSTAQHSTARRSTPRVSLPRQDGSGSRLEKCETCHLKRPKGAKGEGASPGVQHGPAVMRCLQDADWTVRAAAVSALGTLSRAAQARIEPEVRESRYALSRTMHRCDTAPRPCNVRPSAAADTAGARRRRAARYRGEPARRLHPTLHASLRRRPELACIVWSGERRGSAARSGARARVRHVPREQPARAPEAGWRLARPPLAPAPLPLLGPLPPALAGPRPLAIACPHSPSHPSPERALPPALPRAPGGCGWRSCECSAR